VVLRHEPIRRHKLRFDESIVIGPDWDFFMRCADVGDFGYVDLQTCLYRVHRNNITSRIGLERRSLELAKCRTNAIRMPSFNLCARDVRINVFHDLLVNHLRNDPERQDDVTQWPEFAALPAADQARLFRLMASKAIVTGHDHRLNRRWLERCRELNPSDWRGALVLWLYSWSPATCRAALHLRTRRQVDALGLPPFADLESEL
jgi:hypothetical protein